MMTSWQTQQSNSAEEKERKDQSPDRNHRVEKKENDNLKAANMQLDPNKW